MTSSSSFRFRRVIGPSCLQIGQFSNFGWQSLQTTCPLRNWKIGTHLIVLKQTGHSNRVCRSLKCLFTIAPAIFKTECFFQWVRRFSHESTYGRYLFILYGTILAIKQLVRRWFNQMYANVLLAIFCRSKHVTLKKRKTKSAESKHQNWEIL